MRELRVEGVRRPPSRGSRPPNVLPRHSPRSSLRQARASFNQSGGAHEDEGLADLRSTFTAPDDATEARSIESYESYDDEAAAPDAIDALYGDGPDEENSAAAPAPAPGADPLLRCAWREIGSTRGLHFWPRNTPPKAICLMLPSTDGGLGPGVARYPQSLDSCAERKGRGALFLRLAHELAAGRVHNWKYEDTGSRLQRVTDAHGKWKQEEIAGDVASLVLDYSHVNKRRQKLARSGSLETAVDDAFVAATYLMERHANAYLLIVGHGFGGAVGWACAARLCRAGHGRRVAGVACVAGHAFGGDAYDLRRLSTPLCIEASRCPCLFIHGSRDGNVALQISEFLHAKALARARGLSSLTIVSGADHGFASRRDVAFAALRDWALGTLPSGPVPPAKKKKKKKKKDKLIVVNDDDNSVDDVVDATPFSRVIGKREPTGQLYKVSTKTGALQRAGPPQNRVSLRKVRPTQSSKLMKYPVSGMTGFWELDK